MIIPQPVRLRIFEAKTFNDRHVRNKTFLNLVNEQVLLNNMETVFFNDGTDSLP